MVPSKAIQDFVQAIKQTFEYNEMLQSHKKITEDQALSRQMAAYEREQNQIIGLNIPATEKAARLQKLSENYKTFFDNPLVQKFMNTAEQYEKMITECIKSINRQLDINKGGRAY